MIIIRLLAVLFALPARADIVGGEPVAERDPIRRSTVGLFQPTPDGRGGSLCTASLIGKDVALTAAHCLTPGSRPVVLFGRNLQSPDTVRRPVTGVEVHPRWKKGAGNSMDEGDIALVRFPGGLPEGYKPAPTAQTDAKLKRGERAVLAGYGITDARTRAGSGTLRKTEVTIADPRPGKKEMVLDQSHGHGACHGDSGGPAFVREGRRAVLAGVTNRSHPVGAPDDCGHQVVYTKVGANRSWIDRGVRKLRANRTTEELTLPKGKRAQPQRARERAMKRARSPRKGRQTHHKK